MKSVSIAAYLLGAALAVPAADKAAFSAEMYESGEVMRRIMEVKEVRSTNALFFRKLMLSENLGGHGSSRTIQIGRFSRDNRESRM
jgi:hypothetical protein